jgi:hypothetical protein
MKVLGWSPSEATEVIGGSADLQALLHWQKEVMGDFAENQL